MATAETDFSTTWLNAFKKGRLDERGEESAICASLCREERLQYRFMVLYQVLVAILALATLLLLLLGMWIAARAEWPALLASENSGSLIAFAGSVVTGGAAIWLGNQRADARRAHEAAQKGLKENECQMLTEAEKMTLRGKK
jgi:hypothetical protein